MNARAWMDAGTAMFLDTLDRLTDGELDAPSALPGWRHHIIAHVHGSAEALRRLLTWADIGVENRMYAGPANATTDRGRREKTPYF